MRRTSPTTTTGFPEPPAMKIPEDAQVYDLSGDVEPITQKEPLVTNPVQKPREAEEKR